MLESPTEQAPHFQPQLLELWLLLTTTEPMRQFRTVVLSEGALNLGLAPIRSILIIALTLTMTVPTWAQSIAPLAPGAKRVHWNRYINKQYGFSFRYPSTYVPTDTNGRCNRGAYRPCLLALRRRNAADRDRSDASIWVIIWADEPFHLIPGSGNVMPAPANIGTHTFHKGTMGSSGVGITDYYEYNLKNRVLMFEFGPDEHGEPSEETKAVELKLLASFRTF